jgi:hypothetical protein
MDGKCAKQDTCDSSCFNGDCRCDSNNDLVCQDSGITKIPSEFGECLPEAYDFIKEPCRDCLDDPKVAKVYASLYCCLDCLQKLSGVPALDKFTKNSIKGEANPGTVFDCNKLTFKQVDLTSCCNSTSCANYETKYKNCAAYLAKNPGKIFGVSKVAGYAIIAAIIVGGLLLLILPIVLIALCCCNKDR